MKTLCVAIIALVLSTVTAQADDGLVKKLSARGVRTTMDSPENLVRNKGLTVFAQVPLDMVRQMHQLRRMTSRRKTFGQRVTHTP